MSDHGITSASVYARLRDGHGYDVARETELTITVEEMRHAIRVRCLVDHFYENGHAHWRSEDAISLMQSPAEIEAAIDRLLQDFIHRRRKPGNSSLPPPGPEPR